MNFTKYLFVILLVVSLVITSFILMRPSPATLAESPPIIELETQVENVEIADERPDEPCEPNESLWRVVFEPECGNLTLNANEEVFQQQFKEHYPDVNWVPTDMKNWWSDAIITLATLLLEKRIQALEQRHLTIPTEPNESYREPGSLIIKFKEPEEPPEPNESECTHDRSFGYFLVYGICYDDGSYDWRCSHCGQTINSKEKVPFP